MNNPQVSIIVPCFKQVQYLSEALQSVLEQTYKNWECIIVNDGSPDHTEQIAQEWVEKDSRFKYIYKENGGLSSARNAGLVVAIGDFIQFLDADDFLDSRKLKLSINALQLDKTNTIIITNFRMFAHSPAQSSKPYCKLSEDLFVFEAILFKWENIFSIPIHCALFHNSFFVNFRFPDDLKAKEDWIMWLSLFQQDGKVIFIDESLAYYRMHQGSMTHNEALMNQSHDTAVLYMEEVIPKEFYIKFLQKELREKSAALDKLSTSIQNYQNSRSYQFINMCKYNNIIKYFYNKFKF